MTTRDATAAATPHPWQDAGQPVFSIQDLSVDFLSEDGVVHAVRHVSYDLFPGETLAVVGESGSGKTVTVLAALGLLGADNARIPNGSVLLDGKDLLRMPASHRRRILGRDISMIFQDPRTALNPVMTVGSQLAEVLVTHHRSLSRQAVRARATELLELVGVPEPALRMRQYPHQFSGGMCQRVMMAIAIANQPKVLIADEATTAVDVTIQAQLLELLRTAKEATGASTIMITHDLGVVAELADRVCVMYSGEVVEVAEVRQLFGTPGHPYTVGLLSCLPRLDGDIDELLPIPGRPPDLRTVAVGCSFEPRCYIGSQRAQCRTDKPLLREVTPALQNAHLSACHFPPSQVDAGPGPRQCGE